MHCIAPDVSQVIPACWELKFCRHLEIFKFSCFLIKADQMNILYLKVQSVIKYWIKDVPELWI